MTNIRPLHDAENVYPSARQPRILTIIPILLTSTPTMPCPSCAMTKPLETHLDLNVGQPSVVKFEFIPAPCLATTRPAYGEIFTPGAGKYKLSVEPYQPHGRCSSIGCGNCTIQMYEGSAGGASTPDTIRSKPRRTSSSSVHSSLAKTSRSTNNDHNPSPQPSPLPAVVALSGCPARSTAADSVSGCSSPEGTVADSNTSSPARKRQHRQVKGASNEDESDHRSKRRRDDGD